MGRLVVVLCTLFAMCACGEDSSAAETDGAAEIGNIKEQFLLAERYANGNGIETNMQEAAKWYRKAAERGHVKAQYELGLCYANGNGVEKDDAEAKKWFSKAAERGYSKAKNRIQAEQYHQRAEHGDAVAQYELATCYANGRGVAKDGSEARKWYYKAAEQGHFIAQFHLGLMYYKGEGGATNKQEALKWYRKAAEQGHIDAQFNLGMMYYKGEGGATNKQEALKWYRKASEQGHVGAQFQLALMYDKGDGVATNKLAAMTLLQKASEKDYEPAKQLLRKISGAGKDRQGNLCQQGAKQEVGGTKNETRYSPFFFALYFWAACTIFKSLWTSANKRNGIRSLVLRVMAVLGFTLFFLKPVYLFLKVRQAETYYDHVRELIEYYATPEAQRILNYYNKKPDTK